MMENTNMENIETTEQLSGMTLADLRRFFTQLHDLCMECRFLEKGRKSAISCKHTECFLYLLRLIPEHMDSKPQMLTKLLRQRRPLEVADDRIRSGIIKLG